MDELQVRIVKIQCMLNLLKTPFEPVEELKQINSILDRIESKINDYPLCPEKIKEKEASLDRDEIIAETIFPLYWYICEML